MVLFLRTMMGFRFGSKARVRTAVLDELYAALLGTHREHVVVTIPLMPLLVAADIVWLNKNYKHMVGVGLIFHFFRREGFGCA